MTPAPQNPRTPLPLVLRRAGTWRDNIEGLLAAVVLVLIVRHFVFEVFKIPTGSMAPSLLGQHQHVTCPNCGLEFDIDAAVKPPDGEAAAPHIKPITGLCPNCARSFDVRKTRFKSPGGVVPEYIFNFARGISGGNRIIVNKFALHFEPPRRWNVTVFLHPERQKNFIKRLVGLPGETIAIRHGDVFANGRLCRKPYAIQEELWQLVHDSRLVPAETTGDHGMWQVETGTLRLDGPTLTLSPGPGNTARARYGRKILDFTAYNGEGPAGGIEVGDLKWEVSAQLAAPGALRLHLREEMMHYTAEIQFGNGGGHTALTANGTVLATSPFVADVEHEHCVIFSNADDHLALRVDGTLILESEAVIPLEVYGFDYPPSLSGAWIEAYGADAICSRVRLFRDIYYVVPFSPGVAAHSWAIPGDAYFFLGDNTRNSYDSRYSGPFPGKNLIGAAVVIWWPFQYLRPIHKQ